MERLNRHLRARQREGMEGIEVVARRIEYGRSEAEQLRILRVLAEEIGDRDEIWIDITHAFRHLPMLGLLAALHLELSRGVRVRAMYYGALEMKQGGRVPVLRLDGLVRFARWIRALAGWEATGDYARFADLLRQDGVHEDLAGGLVRAAFLEQTQQVGQAAGALRGARPLLAKVPVESVSGLFVRDLDTATAWAEEEGLARRQWSLARNAWGRGLYVRATTLGLEAMITEHARGCGVTDPEDYAHRRASQDALNESFHARKNELRAKDLKTPDEGARELIRYEQLRLLRNALVHSARLKKNPWDLQRVVANPALLKVRLDDLLRGDGRDDAPALLAKIAPKIEV
jgi:CRISPR-associated DxTHG motif protein